MRDVNSASHEVAATPTAGPRLIAVGLAALIAAAWIPGLPILTAMSILTLGATYTTILRFRQSPLLESALLLHAATYTTLYALFVGATLQLGANSPGSRISLLAALDLVASWVFLAIAARQIAAVLRRA